MGEGDLGPRIEEANIDLDQLIGPTVLLMEGSFSKSVRAV